MGSDSCMKLALHWVHNRCASAADTAFNAGLQHANCAFFGSASATTATAAHLIRTLFCGTAAACRFGFSSNGRVQWYEQTLQLASDANTSVATVGCGMGVGGEHRFSTGVFACCVMQMAHNCGRNDPRCCMHRLLRRCNAVSAVLSDAVVDRSGAKSIRLAHGLMVATIRNASTLACSRTIMDMTPVGT